MTDLYDKRFVIVTGKGGVGKTTVVAALALSAARRGKTVLVTMVDQKERLSLLLGSEPVGPKVGPVAPRIDAVNMTPEAALEEYGMMVLKIRAVYRAIFDNRMVKAFLRAVPGIDEWSMLGKAWYHTTEVVAGRPRWDMVILDAPATGHGLDLLRVPKVLLDVAPPSPLRTEAQKCWDLMHDATRSEVLLVTLPEDMPVTETVELHHQLSGTLQFPIERIVVNAVVPPLFTDAETAAILEATDPGAASPIDPDVAPLLAAARTRALRTALDAKHLARVRAELPLQLTTLPFLYTPALGRPTLEALSKVLEAGLA